MDIQAYVVLFLNVLHRHFPDSSVGRESASNVRDLGSIFGLGRSPGGGKGYPKITLAIRGFLYFHKNCEIICSSSVKNTAGSLIGIALNL